MRHSNQTFGCGDVLDAVQLKQIAGKDGKQPTSVASSRLGFTEERNGQTFNSSFLVEAWGEMAARLAAVPPGHSVMFSGKFQTQSYQDQNSGEKRFITKLNLFSVSDCGPSQYPPPQQRQAPQQQSQQPAQGGWNQNQQAPQQQAQGFGGPQSGNFQQPAPQQQQQSQFTRPANPPPQQQWQQPQGQNPTQPQQQSGQVGSQWSGQPVQQAQASAQTQQPPPQQQWAGQPANGAPPPQFQTQETVPF